MIQADGANNLNKDDLVTVITGETRYGMKITNKSQQHLYLYLFHFSCSDFSIESFYEPATAQKADNNISLPPNGSITIGYGDGGGRPWRHFIRDSEVLRNGSVILDKSRADVMLFKLILTTQPADLSFMKQDSPFDEVKGRSRWTARDREEPPEVWATELLTVIVEE
ncbi:hypothetical protein CPB86DRAFT_591237 [Serendipita vermifera]|nr:hypothetical protein CPB86DRAFT_591237 [Serendipita vermifera]